MSRYALRLIACALLLAGLTSLSGCQFLPGGSYWHKDEPRRDYINHDPTQPDT